MIKPPRPTDVVARYRPKVAIASLHRATPQASKAEQDRHVAMIEFLRKSETRTRRSSGGT